MARLDEVRERHAAELRMLELDEQLTEAKANDAVTEELKAEVREARRVFREMRARDSDYLEESDARLAEEESGGDAVAAPATVEAHAIDGREA